MLIRDGRNLYGTFRVKSAPVYVASSRSGRPYCKFYASTRVAMDQEESDDVEYEVMIFGDAAIPASKTILPGALLKIGGRTSPSQYFRQDKVNLFVDCWEPVVQDPYNFVEILKAQMEALAAMHLGNFYKAVGGGEEAESDASDA